MVGPAVIFGYVQRVSAALRALPQEVRFIARRDSAPTTFATISEAASFLESPRFDFSSPAEGFVYQITFSDATEFERAVSSLDRLRHLHSQIALLEEHMAKLPGTTLG